MSAAGARFRAELARLLGPAFPDEGRLGLAVSGGADSLALALLAAEVMPGRVMAATVDHRLHPDGAAWAEQAALACAALDIPHRILTIDWGDAPPAANRQALARGRRYRALFGWMEANGLFHLATGHQLDDQAETLLMRLDRGAGVGGLAGVRAHRLLFGKGGRDYVAVRPLMAFRRAELAALVAGAGLQPVDDPANADPAHDRTRARAFLDASPDFPDRARLAASASLLADADAALEWMAVTLERERERASDKGYALAIADLPRELQFRIARNIVRQMGSGCVGEPRGDTLARALERVRRGDSASLGDIVIHPAADAWHFHWAPPRRSA